MTVAYSFTFAPVTKRGMRVPPLSLQYRRNSTPSSGEPYSLGAGNKNWYQVPPRYQGIVGVKDVEEEIEAIREFSTPSPGGIRVWLKEESIKRAGSFLHHQASSKAYTYLAWVKRTWIRFWVLFI